MSDQNRQNKIVEEAASFADDSIRPFAARFEEDQSLPRDLIQEMAERGYLGAVFPNEYGGLGLDQFHYGRLTEVIGKACASTRSLLTVHTSLVGETLLSFGSEEQKELYLPAMARGDIIACFALTEPSVGTDAKSIQTRIVSKGDTLVITGKKKWITMSGIADLFLVFATDGEYVTAILVERDRPGITTTPIKGLLGGRAAHICEVEFDDVEVPVANVLTKIGSGFTYVASAALDCGRHSIAWGGLAIASECLDAMVRYSRTRTQFGKKICQFQLIQGMIADATTKIHAARAFCEKAARLRDQKHPDAIIETTIAKYLTSKVANEVATDCVQIHGGNGCANEHSAERLFREAKILEIIEGTSQIQQEIISSFALKRYYRKP